MTEKEISQIINGYLSGVYVLTWIVNRKRVRKINLQEQFITAYGGLRGAVGFSLVEMINAEIVPPKQMFVTTTLAVVIFTVFFQVKYIVNYTKVDILKSFYSKIQRSYFCFYFKGATIKFLVNLLDIDKAKSDTKLVSEEVNETVMEHILAGIEIISGRARGSHYLNVSGLLLCWCPCLLDCLLHYLFSMCICVTTKYIYFYQIKD